MRFSYQSYQSNLLHCILQSPSEQSSSKFRMFIIIKDHPASVFFIWTIPYIWWQLNNNNIFCLSRIITKCLSETLVHIVNAIKLSQLYVIPHYLLFFSFLTDLLGMFLEHEK